jgi:hypothetical protein
VETCKWLSKGVLADDAPSPIAMHGTAPGNCLHTTHALRKFVGGDVCGCHWFSPCSTAHHGASAPHAHGLAAGDAVSRQERVGTCACVVLACSCRPSMRMVSKCTILHTFTHGTCYGAPAPYTHTDRESVTHTGPLPAEKTRVRWPPSEMPVHLPTCYKSNTWHATYPPSPVPPSNPPLLPRPPLPAVEQTRVRKLPTAASPCRSQVAVQTASRIFSQCCLAGGTTAGSSTSRCCHS